MPPSVRPFHIMAKPVCGVCNLDCRYCYYSHKPRALYPDVQRFEMPEAVLETFVAQYLQAQPQHCEFGWQGGEPLLAGQPFFRRALELQERLARPGQTVANALQTNGTLLDDAWCELLAERRFLVGLSLDGPADVHDAYRRDHAGNPTFARAWAGLERLRRHGVEFNVLTTLHRANTPRGADLYRYFTNRGVRYLQFIPILERRPNGTPTEESCTPEQFARFLLDMFEVWVARDVGRISERLIDSVLHTLLYGQPAMCCYADRCANAYVLEFNGDLYACDHFVERRWRIGNLLQTPLEELVRSDAVEAFAALKTHLPAVCRDCEYLPFCHGGCPKHHVPLYGGPDRVNHFCAAYKAFFGAALPELRRIAADVRAGRPLQPKTAAEALRSVPAVPAELRRPPGRNDPCPCGSGRKFKHCCGRGR